MPLNPAPIQQDITADSKRFTRQWTLWFQSIVAYSKNVLADTVQLTGGTGTAGTISWNADEETLDLIQNGAVLQLGQELQVHCKNQTGSDIADGTPVMAVGTLGSSGRILISPMDGTNSANAKYFLGITTETIVNGDDGKVTVFGKVRGLNTNAYNEGDVLWISASTVGALTNTEPALDKIGMPIAFVINKHTHNGTIMVRASSLDEHVAAQRVNSYTVAGLPSASVAGQVVFVSNESGGAVLAFSDGTNWRRVTDRAVVS